MVTKIKEKSLFKMKRLFILFIDDA